MLDTTPYQSLIHCRNASFLAPGKHLLQCPLITALTPINTNTDQQSSSQFFSRLVKKNFNTLCTNLQKSHFSFSIMKCVSQATPIAKAYGNRKKHNTKYIRHTHHFNTSKNYKLIYVLQPTGGLVKLSLTEKNILVKQAYKMNPNYKLHHGHHRELEKLGHNNTSSEKSSCKTCVGLE